MAPLTARQTTIIAPDPDINNPSATAAPPTGSDINSRADIYGGSHSGLTNGQIGAVIGSVVGFTILVLALIFCAIKKRRVERRRRRQRRRYYEDSSYGSGSSGSSSSGGGGGKGRGAERGRSMRKPPAARVRRHVTVVDREDEGDAWEGWDMRGAERMRERERIPGGPKWPTYRAIPIPNPRKNPNLRRHL